MARMLLLRALRRFARDPAQALRLRSEVAELRERQARAQEVCSRGELLKRVVSFGAALGGPVAPSREDNVLAQHPLPALAGGAVARRPLSASIARRSIRFAPFTSDRPFKAPKRLCVSGSTRFGEFRLDFTA